MDTPFDVLDELPIGRDPFNDPFLALDALFRITSRASSREIQIRDSELGGSVGEILTSLVNRD